MRLKSSHLLIVAVIALFLVGIAVFIKSRPEQARDHATTAAGAERLRSATPGSSGRERCMKKCAAIHRGYVYRAEQDVGAAGSRYVEPEVCTCV
jgi:hypothetical protein